MVENGVCAVIVTFNPQPKDLSYLIHVRPQVQDMVVVDNGSPKESVDILRVAGSETGFSLLENRVNLGLGAAVNVGTKWAELRGYNCVLLLDQDSAITDGFVDAMLAKYHYCSSLNRKPIGIIVPSYVDQNRDVDIPPVVNKDMELITAMTSGSLIPMAVLSRHGGFNESLFVDGVDTEYSLRLRRLGYVIIQCSEAVLRHSPGLPEVHKIMGLIKITTYNYNAKRRYLKTRNKLWLLRRYWKYDLKFGLSLCFGQIKDTIKMLVFEDFKWKKLVSTCRGFRDGFRDISAFDSLNKKIFGLK